MKNLLTFAVVSLCVSVTQATCPGVPCLNGGACNANGKCDCLTTGTVLYQGPRCANPRTAACVSVTCANRGFCTPAPTFPNGVFCDCEAGFSGPLCRTGSSSSLCFIGKCKNGATCNPTTGACTCTPFFQGQDCSQVTVCSGKCKNGATCNTITGACTCTQFFQGQDCSQVKSGQCPYVPSCNNGLCEDLRAANSAANPATRCNCYAGWQGTYCNIVKVEQKKVDKCTYIVCLNGGKCKSNCKTTDDATCVCPYPWDGQFCEQRKQSTCPKIKCQNSHGCLDTNFPPYFNCNCKAGFAGQYCDKKAPMPNAKCTTSLDCQGLLCSGAQAGQVGYCDWKEKACKCKPAYVKAPCSSDADCRQECPYKFGMCMADKRCRCFLNSNQMTAFSIAFSP